MRLKIVGTTTVVLIALAVTAAPAVALVTDTPGGGRIGYLPLNDAAGVHNGAPIRNTFPSGEPPLEYHGGPVMHSQTAYAIFWAPSGYSFPAGYTSAITSYLENVAADSGKPSNVYAVSAQYTDGTGNASYVDSLGDSVSDTNAYPTSGTCPAYNGFAETFTACISDEKMAAEVNAVVAAQGWPNGLGAEYYVVLPPHAGSCFEADPEEEGEGCFDSEFCAYHNYAETSELVYSNISYSPGDTVGCGVGQYPNGHANGNVDDTLSSLSHEANESITDPTLEAWFDQEGFENGDECRNTPFHEDYGAPLGGSSGTLFNQAINGAHYYLQQEWSNDILDCAQRVTPPVANIADPGQVLVGHSVSLDGSSSSPGSGGIAAYQWNFGDGGTASGQSPSHTFLSPGEFTVTLTLEDDGGFMGSATQQVSVATAHNLAVSIGGAGTGKVTGPGISCPGSCVNEYASSSSVLLTATPSAGSAFSGWSGGGCSGTGSCEVAMSSDRAVTATFVPTHRLTVSLAGTGAGAVAGVGISCPGTCARDFPAGELVTLIATPAANSSFAGWAGAGCSGTGACEVTMGSDLAVTAAFTASSGGSGGGSILTPVTAAPKVSTGLKCRKGFRKIKKGGKTVCAKVKKKHRKHRHG